MKKPNTPNRVRSSELVMPYFRVILSKLIHDDKWQIISNPRWDTFTRAQSDVLLNEFNDYAEYTNCGVVYRMVRVKDLDKYLDDTRVKPEWALNLRHNDKLRHGGE